MDNTRLTKLLQIRNLQYTFLHVFVIVLSHARLMNLEVEDGCLMFSMWSPFIEKIDKVNPGLIPVLRN